MPKRDPVRRIDLNNQGLFASGPLTSSRSPQKYWGTLVVAAADSSADGKAGANYICDSSADEVEINAAINALGGADKCVRLLEGTYRLTDRVILVDNVSLVGQGDSTIVKGITTGLEFIQAADNNEIRGMKLDGESRTGTSGIEADTVTNLLVSDVTFQDFVNIGIIFDSSTGLQVQGCHFIDTGAGMNGIQGTTSTDICITGNYFEGCSEGIYLVSDDITVTGNFFVGCGNGIDIEGDDVAVTGNTVDSASGTGINYYNGSGATIAGNTCYVCDEGIVLSTAEQCTVTGNTCLGDGTSNGSFGIDLDTVDHCVIVGNTCSGNGAGDGGGIYLTGSSNNLIADNVCIGNSQSTSTNPASNGTFGIKLAGDSDRNLITGNLTRKSLTGSSNIQQYGIRIGASTCNNNQVVENDTYLGGNTAGISDAGTDTYIRRINGGTPRKALTVATGAVTVVGSGFYSLLPESGTADDIDTINGGEDGIVIYVRNDNVTNTVTLKDGTGNLDLQGADVALNAINVVQPLIYDETQTLWLKA